MKWVFAAIVCVVALMLIAQTMVLTGGASRRASVAALPKVVDGHVYDSLSMPVAGASVTVTILDGTTERTHQDVVTDGDGFYYVTFMELWAEGNTIKVDASYDLLSGTSSVVADASYSQTVDVHFSEPIPEFGSLVVVCSAVIVIFAVMSSRSRRKRDA